MANIRVPKEFVQKNIIDHNIDVINGKKDEIRLLYKVSAKNGFTINNNYYSPLPNSNVIFFTLEVPVNQDTIHSLYNWDKYVPQYIMDDYKIRIYDSDDTIDHFTVKDLLDSMYQRYYKKYGNKGDNYIYHWTKCYNKDKYPDDITLINNFLNSVTSSVYSDKFLIKSYFEWATPESIKLNDYWDNFRETEGFKNFVKKRGMYCRFVKKLNPFPF